MKLKNSTTKYCLHCGRKLYEFTVNGEHYSELTGKRGEFVIDRCPSWWCRITNNKR